MKELEPIFQSFLTDFYKNGEDVLRSIINCAVPSEIVLMRYKIISPIESLTLQQKNDLWKFAREMYPDEKRKEELIRVAKIIHTVGTCL